MDVIWVTLAAVIGALALAIMGWLNAIGESFNPRKFVGSVITAVISGVGVAVAYDYTNQIGIIDIFLAFLIGTGADASRKALADVLRNKFG